MFPKKTLNSLSKTILFDLRRILFLNLRPFGPLLFAWVSQGCLQEPFWPQKPGFTQGQHQLLRTTLFFLTQNSCFRLLSWLAEPSRDPRRKLFDFMVVHSTMQLHRKKGFLMLFCCCCAGVLPVSNELDIVATVASLLAAASLAINGIGNIMSIIIHAGATHQQGFLHSIIKISTK